MPGIGHSITLTMRGCSGSAIPVGDRLLSSRAPLRPPCRARRRRRRRDRYCRHARHGRRGRSRHAGGRQTDPRAGRDWRHGSLGRLRGARTPAQAPRREPPPALRHRPGHHDAAVQRPGVPEAATRGSAHLRRSGDRPLGHRRPDAGSTTWSRMPTSPSPSTPISWFGSSGRRAQGSSRADLSDMIAVSDSRAPVAQLDRAPGFEPVGRGFKSLRAHQSFIGGRTQHIRARSSAG